MRFAVLVLLLATSFACGNSRGKFAFAVADDSELGVLEKNFFHPRRFTSYQRRPIFEQDDVLWYAYRPASPQYGIYYGVSLQKKSLGYQEIDLRNHKIADGQDMLIDHYRDLAEGEYRLKVALNNKVIDQVDFLIVADAARESVDFAQDEPEGTPLAAVQ